MKPEVKRIGSAYVYTWPEPEPVEIEIDQVRQKSDDWVAWMIVRHRGKHQTETTQTLSAMQSRTSLARYLKERVDLDWAGYLEVACIMTIRSEREGEPFVTAGSMEEHPQEFWLIEPVVRVGKPTVLYGDGGAGKSTTALMLASTVLAGREIAGFSPSYTGPVLYLDWETDREEIDDSLKALKAGHGIEIPDIHYRREVWPLAQSARQIKRFIDANRVDLVVVDSIGMALGDDPESALVVMKFFQAVRSFGCAALCIDHITKAGSNGKPFGSVYKHNAARLTFEVRRHQLPEENVMHIAMYHTKANKGGFQKPVGLAVTFEEGSIRFGREDIPQDAAELQAGMPAQERIKQALRASRESMTATDIAAWTDIKEAVVKARLSEMVRRGTLISITTPTSGPERYSRRYALKSDREDMEA